MMELVAVADFSVNKYTPQDAPIWDAFIDLSINGTFLFKRSFMDYHKDRFLDNSYLIWNKGNLVGVFVAAVSKTATDQASLVAHPGLTYGGLVLGEGAKYAQVENIYNYLFDRIKQDGFSRVIIKPVSRVFCKEHSQASDFYFYKNNFSLVSREINSVIDLNRELRLTRARRKNLKKAAASGLVIYRSNDCTDFWKIMTDSLMKTHGVRPVHTIEEMHLLSSANPDNIHLYLAVVSDKVVGGTLLFVDVLRGFVHSQYTHANEEGRELRAIDALVINAVEESKKQGISKFSFGISTVNSEVNYGLLSQKEDFGSDIELIDVYEKFL